MYFSFIYLQIHAMKCQYLVSLYRYKTAMQTMGIQHRISYFPDQESVLLWVDSASAKKLQKAKTRENRVNPSGLLQPTQKPAT